MIKVAINGALGKMGKVVTQLCLQDKDIKIVGLADIAGTETKQINNLLPQVELNLNNCINQTDVVIDFSSPEGTQQVLQLCKEYKKPAVVGTTGHTEEQLNSIKTVANYIPVVLSPNMSLGVNILFKLVEIVTNILKDKNYDIEIIEAHHNKKKDAPSGTAKKIMEIVKFIKQNTEFVFNRNGLIGERKPQEVGINVIRAGDIVGEHTVLFATHGEKIELKHTATSRECFAKGAIFAAKWVVDKKPGLYTMKDVLQI